MGAFYDAAYETGKNGQYFDLEQAKHAHEAVEVTRTAPRCSCSPTTPASIPRQAEMVQAQLAKIGVKVNIELADAPTFRRRWLQERQWDLVQIQWDADLDPDETLFPELHSAEAWNAGKWVNKDFDKMVEGGAVGERLQEAQEVLRGSGEDHHRGHAGGHPPPHERA